MPKTWSEVEQSQEYNNLSVPDRLRAKQQYFDTVVSQKPEYVALPDEEKKSAKQQFLGSFEETPPPAFDPLNHPFKTAFTPISKFITGKSIGERADLLNKAGNKAENESDLNVQKNLQNQINAPGARKTIEVPKTPGTFGMFMRQLPAATGQALINTVDLTPADVATLGAIKGLSKVPVGTTNLGEIATKVPIRNPFSSSGRKAMAASVKALQDAGVPAAQAAIDSQIKQAINQGMSKGVRPSVAGKQTPAKQQQFNDNSVTAVKDIVLNKGNHEFIDAEGNLKYNQLPENLSDFAQSIQQGMKRVFGKYNDIASKAGDEGAKIDLKPYSSKLKKLVDDKVFRTEHPADYAKVKSIYDGINLRRSMTPLEAQDKIAEWNADLAPGYKNGFKYGSTRAQNVVRDITGDLRSDLDKTIESATGEQYQSLKNLYGAYKSLTKDVMNRAIVVGRQNPKGIWNFLDMAGNGEIFGGAAAAVTGHPQVGIPAMIKGLTLKAGKSWIETANNPNNIVKGMFSKVDGLISKMPKVETSAITPEIVYNAPPLVKAQGNLSFNPLNPITSTDRMLPSPKTAGSSSGPVIYGKDWGVPSEDPYGFLAEAKKAYFANKSFKTPSSYDVENARPIVTGEDNPPSDWPKSWTEALQHLKEQTGDKDIKLKADALIKKFKRVEGSKEITSEFNPLKSQAKGSEVGDNINKSKLILPAALGGALLMQKESEASKPISEGQELRGKASTYGWGEKLNPYTFSGERFNTNAKTVAMRGVPMGTKVEITDNKTGNKVIATVNDGGPGKRLNRLIDLSKGAWKELGYGKPGLLDVSVKIVSVGKGRAYNGKY